MVVVAILGVLTALAAPSFTPLVERWRVRSSAEDLTSTLYFARSEAIKRGGNVIIAKNPDVGDCSTGAVVTEWSCGWRVFFDVNGDGSQDACVASDTLNECDLQMSTAPTRMQVTLPSSTGSITVDRWGMSSHTPSGGGSGTPTAMSFELMPKGKTVADPSAAKLCSGTGGRIVRIKSTESCS